MQNKNDALPPFVKQLFIFAQLLKNPEVVAKLKMPIWGAGQLLFTPPRPRYIAVGNYKVHWCTAWELKGVSVDFTIREAPFSQTKTTAEHLRQVGCRMMRPFEDVLKLFETENDLEWAGIYLHESSNVICPARDGGTQTGETN